MQYRLMIKNEKTEYPRIENNLLPYPDVKASCIISTAIPCYAIPLEPLFLPVSCPFWEGFPP